MKIKYVKSASYFSHFSDINLLFYRLKGILLIISI